MSEVRDLLQDIELGSYGSDWKQKPQGWLKLSKEGLVERQTENEYCEWGDNGRHGGYLPKWQPPRKVGPEARHITIYTLTESKLMDLIEKLKA